MGEKSWPMPGHSMRFFLRSRKKIKIGIRIVSATETSVVQKEIDIRGFETAVGFCCLALLRSSDKEFRFEKSVGRGSVSTCRADEEGLHCLSGDRLSTNGRG